MAAPDKDMINHDKPLERRGVSPILDITSGCLT